MFQFPGFAFVYHVLHRFRLRRHSGCPIWRSMDKCLGLRRPHDLSQLYRVLHRLGTPRHPPYALCRFNYLLCHRFHLCPMMSLLFSKMSHFNHSVHTDHHMEIMTRTSVCLFYEVFRFIVQGRALKTKYCFDRCASTRIEVSPWTPSVLHRKEVIQPLVLERLPCYDFTPIIGPTLDS